MSARVTAHQNTLDAVVQRQVNDLVRQGLDTSLKLSLLAEGWHALQRAGLVEPYTAQDFARRVCADSQTVHQQLEEMVVVGFFERTEPSKKASTTYCLTTDPARRDALRLVLLSWGNIRFRMRASMVFAFRPGSAQKAA